MSAKNSLICLLAVGLLVTWIPSPGQNSASGASSSGEEIIPFLNQSVNWHRQLTTQQQLATEPADVLFLRDNRQLADQIVRLSFDFARARAQVLANQPNFSASSATPESSSSQYQRLAELVAKVDAQVKQSQQELDTMRNKLETAAGSKRGVLLANIAETESELELFQARRDAMRSMLQVSSTNGGQAGASSLPAQIEELARTVPDIWRRATFRYVTDPRRRNQFLLLRRIALWCVMAVIISVAFASEIGAITTFAGLLTIGITLALQNVILSLAGYFFLIGKYGIRVGDRVQVAGITGDVVDIGIVRLHLMEVTGGPSPRPTGRVVVFPNAVVFQAGAGLFKQIPGTNFLWHEITLTLRPEQNYLQVEQRLLDAVKKVFAGYQDTMERQRRNVERNLQAAQIGSFAPESRLRLTASGLEIVIRYPVELSSAAETDDRVTRQLLEAIAREPKLSLLGAQIEAKSA